MATFANLAAAVTQRIKDAQAAAQPLAAAAAAVVLQEDAHDLQTEINKSIGQIGMLILVGMPHAANLSTGQSKHLERKVEMNVAIGEHPILWRKVNPDNSVRPPSSEAVNIISEFLNGFQVGGFQKLHVVREDYIPDGKRQLYEISLETKSITPTS